MIAPATKAAHYDPVGAGGVLPQPGMWWWAARPVTDDEAAAQARERLDGMLADLASMGVSAEGDTGSSSPLQAIEKEVERRFRLPVTTIITSF